MDGGLLICLQSSSAWKCGVPEEKKWEGGFLFSCLVPAWYQSRRNGCCTDELNGREVLSKQSSSCLSFIALCPICVVFSLSEVAESYL